MRTTTGAAQSGVLLQIINGSNAVLTQGQTDGQGAAALSVAAGSFRICETVPAGFVNSSPGLFDAQGRACYWYTLGAGSQINVLYVNQ
jgi:uncharacterized protein YfaS (alpha-2-macroglobulin family)